MAYRLLKSTRLIKFKALYEPVFSEIIRSHQKILREFLYFFLLELSIFFHIAPKIQSIKILIRKIEQIQAEISLTENIQDSRPLMGSCAIEFTIIISTES